MSQILVVGTTAERIARVTDPLTDAYDVFTAVGFREALQALGDRSPSLMISEVRLEEFNGLHLMIRAQTSHSAMRVILIDRTSDPVLQSEAHRHGALYLVEPVDGVELLEHVSRMQSEVTPHRRFPRKSLAVDQLVAQVARGSVPVVDLSYGGLRLEVLDPSDVGSGIDVIVPGFEVAVRARPVWTCPAPSGRFWCGAELSESNPQAVSVWRRLVDSVHA
jgi:DNA-binding response OmpR family regulator